MVDITEKRTTLRQAIAEATVKVSKPETITAIQEDKVPKGNVFAMAKAAGLLAVKKTPDLLPDCHPLPIEYTGISYSIEGLEIKILLEVKTIYKTGVEVEAMHGASVVALTMYDMLKPIDKGIEIERVRLVSKKGGKSDLKRDQTNAPKATVLVASNSLYSGEKENKVGPQVTEHLTSYGVDVGRYDVIAATTESIQEQLLQEVADETPLLVFVGGTGLASEDLTPDAVRPLFDREVEGITDAARAYGLERTPYAMFSRNCAGIRDSSLILCIPGSTNGAKETLDAIFPVLLHALPKVNQKRS